LHKVYCAWDIRKFTGGSCSQQWCCITNDTSQDIQSSQSK